MDKIRALANQKGMSLPQLEQKLGLGNGTISRWRSSSPNTGKLQKIADYFGVSMDYLLGRENSKDKRYFINEETAHVAQEIFENKELKALFDIQRDMNPDDLKALHNMALALKRKERDNMDGTGC